VPVHRRVLDSTALALPTCVELIVNAARRAPDTVQLAPG